MVIEFYHNDWDFDLSGCDSCSYEYPKSKKRIIKILRPLVDRSTNIRIHPKCKYKIFFKDFYLFCKEEHIAYTPDTIWNFTIKIELPDRVLILVREGVNENVHMLTI